MTKIKIRILRIYRVIRKIKYLILSDCKNVTGKPNIGQPVQLIGKGHIHFNGTVTLGVFPSPFFLSGYIYIEARYPDSKIEIGNGAIINNNTSIMSAGEGIVIGARTLIGYNCEIMDSDFHDVDPVSRHTGLGKTGMVVIGENVLIGSNVKILKGVTIGGNSVIGNGALVTRSVPENSLAYGNPLKIGRTISK